MRGSDNNDIISSRKFIFNRNLANSKLQKIKSTTIAATSGTARHIAATTTTTTTTTDNTLGNQLLLKKQLHLNLKERANDKIDASNVAAAAATAICYKDNNNGDDDDENDNGVNDYDDDYDDDCSLNYHENNFNNDDDVNNEETIRNRRKQFINDISNLTTVPKLLQTQHVKTSQPMSSTSASLLRSSPTALAKFNRIIDATVPTSNVYHQTLQQQQQQQQPLPSRATTIALETRLAMAYHKNNNIVSEDSLSMQITTESTTVGKKETIKFNYNNNKSEVDKKQGNNKNADDNQVKRNDVHYLLKQLNSFSDIEEIEIVDMKKKKINKNRHDTKKLHNNERPAYDDEDYSPSTKSLVLISPSSLSHKGIRRYASLYQRHEKLPVARVATSISEQEIPPPESGERARLQQFDDYIFESCHYLETNQFAANYRTAMIESKSHEFRPSLTTCTSSVAYSSHSSVHEATSQAQQQQQQQTRHHNHYHHPYATVNAQQPPVLGPPARRFEIQTRLTSSGVQTELTPGLLSTTTTASTNAYMAKNSSSSQSGESGGSGGIGVSGSTSKKSINTSLSSSEARLCRRMPIFKCCYTPLDRWCERRSAASAASQAAAATSTTATATTTTTAVVIKTSDLSNKNKTTGSAI